MSNRSNRRDFLTQAAAVTATAGLVPYFSWSPRALANDSKNDRPRVACIGLGGMGRGNAKGHSAHGDIVAVCDVDAGRLARAKGEEGVGDGKADAYADYRRVLQREDVDLVSISTPDHWHVKIALEALQAGKHVFCEKPLTLTLEEGQLIRKACQKHPELVFFVGTQQRATKPRFLRAVNMVQKGLLGDITKVTIGIGGGVVGGPFDVSDPPPNLDWDFWLGPAPKVDYIRQRCHYQFRWWYEYSGGKFTDWGAHHIDIALWALDQNGPGQGPVEFDGSDAKHPVEFKDGYPTVDNHYNTSHDYAVKCRFDGGPEMIVTSRDDNGILFEGTKGRIFVSRSRITGKPIEENWDEGQFTDEDVVRLYKGKPFENHKANLFRCLREGGQPVSDVYTHVQAMNVCHLAAIAARLGRTIRWNPKDEKFVDDDQAAGFFARTPRKGFEFPTV